jgi:excisionase family DNA binding protein
MSALAFNLEDTTPPTADEMAAASEAARVLTRHLPDKTVKLSVLNRSATETVEIPANAFRMVVNLLSLMGNGNAVTVMPLKGELTTQQAAHVLNVSRPHVIKLIDNGQLKARQVGTHRKLAVEDVLDFQSKNRSRRRLVLADLVELDQELDTVLDATDTTAEIPAKE